MFMSRMLASVQCYVAIYSDTAAMSELAITYTCTYIYNARARVRGRSHDSAGNLCARASASVYYTFCKVLAIPLTLIGFNLNTNINILLRLK